VKHEFDIRTDDCKFCGLPASGLKEFPQLADCAGRTAAPSAGGANVPADPETPASDEAAKV
jgi:predicted nucleic acid binding AN1-type Zn finger protein